ncbi:LysR family transcriptional regulator [Marinobacter sp.]|uniref:LysR family transcriptional regulator n=1 Tax=Marinobacter sp. TaxID=50741 RepID=UPI003B51B5A5
MTNDQLRAFIAVVEHGSFRAAASQVHKTQPTISAAVATLEDEFGFLLFTREGYRPVLTAEGKAFYQEARRLLKQVTKLESLGHHLAKGAPSTLSISMSAMCALPPRLNEIKAFCDAYPDLQLTISTEHLSGILELLHLERADVAIGPDIGLDSRYDFVEIGKITMVTVASPEFTSSGHGDVIKQASLRNRPHILVADTGSLSPLDNINILPGGRRWFVKDYQVKKALLLSGMGWARIPLHMVEAELRCQDLMLLEIENFTSRNDVPIYLIRLRQNPLSKLGKAFWNTMIDRSAGY